jgi:hypothetical protein
LQRHGSGLSHDDPTARDFARLIGEFAGRGYLAEVFGEYCVDDHNDLSDASEVIERHLGIPGLWPLAPGDVGRGNLLRPHRGAPRPVSRLATRWPHNFGGCGWHHSEFRNGPARILYRWKVNELLRSAGIEYELAAEGEDLGAWSPSPTTREASWCTAPSTTAHRTSPPGSATHRPLPGT